MISSNPKSAIQFPQKRLTEVLSTAIAVIHTGYASSVTSWK